MQVATGTIVEGKVVLEGVSLPEGTVVTVFAKDSEATVRLPPVLQAELEEALKKPITKKAFPGTSSSENCRSRAKLGADHSRWRVKAV
jgi:hypothetical protein